MGNLINKYCITNGTVNDVQKDLFEGGHIPGKADISYAVDAARSVMIRGSMREYQDFGYAGACAGFIYQSLYCFGKTMFQNAGGREIPCSQLVFCSAEDARNGDAFLREIICFPYLSMDELLASEAYTKEMVFQRPSRDPAALVQLTRVQENGIARAICWLLQEKEVILQLPAGDNYEELAVSVLYRLFKAIPGQDRCEISFSTARNGSDIRRLNGRLKLILTNENVSPFGDAKWIKLNGAEELTAEERAILKWMHEPETVYEDISRFLRNGRLANKNRGLKWEYMILQQLYDEKLLWWKTAPDTKKFSSFGEVMEEYRKNPTLSIRDNQRQFFCSLMDRIQDDAKEGPDEEALMGLLMDYIFQEKVRLRSGKEISLFEDERVLNQFFQDCAEKYTWFGKDERWRDRFLQEMGLLKEILVGS